MSDKVWALHCSGLSIPQITARTGISYDVVKWYILHKWRQM